MPSPFPGMDPYLEGDHPLPTFGVPLLDGDADVSLDLQTCFQNVYDLSGLDLVMDY